jgi:CheY-like chemotaxis protein
MSSVLLLLVEDEPMILHDVEDALTDGGYEVVTALSGAEAMAQLDDGKQFAGLITDIRLRDEMNGWEIARRVREANSGVAVIYITADSSADWSSQGVPGSLLVQKPFANAQLVTAISTLLTEIQSVPHA